MPYKPELVVVIPVYNEAQNLPGLLRDWQDVFRSTGAAYQIILIDDGSKDNSLSLLQSMAADDPTLLVHTQPNAGHGPAILKGYRMADQAEWVFQIDSDHQLDTAAFAALWANRHDRDLLIGQRLKKNATKGRQYISMGSQLVVRLLFGPAVHDVNSPYRLMRGSLLRPALDVIPADSFAPNVLLTAWFVRKKARIFTTPVSYRREGLRASTLNGYFLRGALRSFLQTILFRIK